LHSLAQVARWILRAVIRPFSILFSAEQKIFQMYFRVLLPFSSAQPKKKLALFLQITEHLYSRKRLPLRPQSDKLHNRYGAPKWHGQKKTFQKA